MVYFICIGSVELWGTRNKRKLQNEKFLHTKKPSGFTKQTRFTFALRDLDFTLLLCLAMTFILGTLQKQQLLSIIQGCVKSLTQCHFSIVKATVQTLPKSMSRLYTRNLDLDDMIVHNRVYHDLGPEVTSPRPRSQYMQSQNPSPRYKLLSVKLFEFWWYFFILLYVCIFIFAILTWFFTGLHTKSYNKNDWSVKNSIQCTDFRQGVDTLVV